MSDKELLELAAKAAGIKIDKSTSNGGGMSNTGFDVAGNAVLDWHNFKWWNPLTDDGDAMRLLATKEMCVDFMNQIVIAGDNPTEILIDFLDGDYKRAIVRAAAEIGKAMP